MLKFKTTNQFEKDYKKISVVTYNEKGKLISQEVGLL